MAERDAIAIGLYSLIAERGYSDLTIEDLCLRAAVDRAVFERHFDSLEQGCVALWEEGVQEFLQLTTAAFFAAPSWHDGMRAAAWAYCCFLQKEPLRSRFLIELASKDDLLEAKRDFIMSRWAELVDQGRHQPGAEPEVPRAQAEAIVGAIWERQAKAIRDGAFDRLPDLIPEGMYLTVLPYLGTEAADEELRRGPADIAAYRRREP